MTVFSTVELNTSLSFIATQSTLDFVDNHTRAQLLLRWPRNVAHGKMFTITVVFRVKSHFT